MSSHREAPQISKDPVADTTDLYAFVSPDQPDTVTLIANYVPLRGARRGPELLRVRRRRPLRHQHRQRRGRRRRHQLPVPVHERDHRPRHVPLQHRADHQPHQPDLEPAPDLHRSPGWTSTGATCSGPGSRARRATSGRCPRPTSPDWWPSAITTVAPGTTVFAGQRAEGFYVDLGAIFDLGDPAAVRAGPHHVRPAGTGLGADGQGVNATDAVNVHSIAIQVPMSQLTASGEHADPVADPGSVIGVWTTASRQTATDLRQLAGASNVQLGPLVQVSRLGNPLVNEVLIPMAPEGLLEPPSRRPRTRSSPRTSPTPSWPGSCPCSTPAVLPQPGRLRTRPGQPRADLVAILLTGIPTGVVPGFQNYTGHAPGRHAAAEHGHPAGDDRVASNLGLLGGDPAGFPNGRRVFDDVVTIEVQAIAGATLRLVDPSFTPGRRRRRHPGLTSGPTDLTAMGTENYLPEFPYLGTPTPASPCRPRADRCTPTGRSRCRRRAARAA